MGRRRERTITFRTFKEIWDNLDRVAENRGEEGPNGLTRALMEALGQSPDGMTPDQRKMWEVINILAGRITEQQHMLDQILWMNARMMMIMEMSCRYQIPESDSETIMDLANRSDVVDQLLRFRMSLEVNDGSPA